MKKKIEFLKSFLRRAMQFMFRQFNNWECGNPVVSDVNRNGKRRRRGKMLISYFPSFSLPPLIHLILQNLREIPPPTQMLATFLFRSFRQALNVYPSSLLFSTANRNHLAYCKCEI
jgi:hypothetical protein